MAMLIATGLSLLGNNNTLWADLRHPLHHFLRRAP
jgi:hypothetical protein